MFLAAVEPTPSDARLNSLASAHTDVVRATTLATSTGGRPIRLLAITSTSGTPSPREPAAPLLVAGADGRHRIGVEAAIALAEKYAAAPPDWLNKTTLYIVPCLNPDAFAYPGPTTDSGRLRIPADADHDGRVDEDGGEDPDGDAIIAMMRVRDPGPGVPGKGSVIYRFIIEAAAGTKVTVLYHSDKARDLKMKIELRP